VGQRHRGLIVGLALAACGGDRDASDADAAARSRPTGRAADAGPPTTDRRGELLAGETILGVVVPRAMKRTAGAASTDRATFEARVPMEKVIRFVQRRVVTGNVETGPNGARFVDARPRPPGDPSKTVTVWAYDAGRGTTRLVIYDHSTRPGPPPTDAEAARAFPPKQNDTKAPGTE
jgi:hypothetical protein